MYSQLYLNLVAYKHVPPGRRRYRQIAVVEKEQFELRIFEGDVVQLEPKFLAESSDAEVHFYSNLETAKLEAEKEFQDSFKNGWQAYNSDH